MLLSDEIIYSIPIASDVCTKAAFMRDSHTDLSSQKKPMFLDQELTEPVFSAQNFESLEPIERSSEPVSAIIHCLSVGISQIERPQTEIGADRRYR